jgi:DNA-binding LacI/PurR family transcriptional regulator
MRNGALPPGQILPTVRMLADQFQVSLSVANQAVQELVEEGLVYTEPRLGTFVGQRHLPVSEFYLLLLPAAPVDAHARGGLQVGFETRITQLGGASLVLDPEQALRHRERGEMPPLAGVFNYAFNPDREVNWHADGVTPHVGFTSWAEDPEHSDLVSLDDMDGGNQAAHALLAAGHRRIAYFALHAERPPYGTQLWSAEREQGWRQAMQEAGLDPVGLAFHPSWPDPRPLHPEVGELEPTARQLIACDGITAVVAANDMVALVLFRVLRAVGIPPERWPAVVGFDNLPEARPYPLTSFHLPWDEVGRAAADLLWQRRHGQLTGEYVHRRVQMRLIRRISSQTGWSVVAQAITGGAAEPATLG